MHELTRQVVLAIAYSGQFDFPITSSEIWLRIDCSRLGRQLPGKSRVLFLEVLRVLKQLAADGVVKRVGKYWVLAGGARQVSLRVRRALITQSKLAELRPLLTICSILPCVDGLVVTGSAAVNNASDEHDVDLLVITKSHTLWLVRPFLLFIALLFGKRRSWNHEEPNSWCFNLWLDESDLEINHTMRTRYLAYESLQTRWLVARGDIKQRFFTANTWICHIFPRWFALAAAQQADRQLWSWDWLIFAARPVVMPLHILAYVAQRWYMKTHQTREKVSYTAAFFHPRDTRGMIMDGWRRQLRSLGVGQDVVDRGGL
ncbi:MAG: hypothetical protein WDZ94_05080 [Patescibacteria group bacterium]